MDEKTVVSVLLALWRQRTLPLEALAAAAEISQAEAMRAVDELSRRCVIERTPQAIELVSSGPAVWRDIVESTAREDGKRLGRSVQVFQKTASTNDVCWAAAGQAGADGLVVLADEQTAGRGRRGNAWAARAGQSVLMSVLLDPLRMDAGVEMLTLLAGLAVAEGIEEAAGCDCQIKWPNDIQIAGKKVAGILVERRGAAGVIGVGLNVAQHPADFPEELRSRATSLYAATGKQIDRLRVIQRILERLESRMAGGEDWLPEWKNRCAMLGSTIEIITGGMRLRGRVLDVDPQQGLALRDELGNTHWCSAMTSTIGI